MSFCLFLVLGFHVGVWAVQLGALAAALRLDAGRLGVALSGAALGGILTLFVGGRIADRFGRRAVLVIGFAVTGGAFLGLAAAQTFAQAVAAVVVYGLAISFIDLGANAVGSDFEHAHRTDALTGLQAGFSLGALTGALAAAVMLAVGVDHRWIYAGLALLFVVAALASSRLPLPVQRPAQQRAAAEGDSRPVWRLRGVLFAAVVVLVGFLGDGVLEGFLAVFLRRALDSGVLLSGVGIAVFHLASFLGRSLVAPAQDRLPPRRLIPAAGALAAAGMGIALLSPVAWGSIAGMLVVGFAVSPVVPTALSLAGRAAPDRAGQAVAFTTAVGYISFLIGPLVVGGLAAATDLRVGLSVVAATSLTLALLGTGWPREAGRDGAAVGPAAGAPRRRRRQTSR
ncbi:MFS transporter [Amnibacterium endophyticum]|uniref:MFS transporter n=1 Tax=Amnibacterium endophyticum TaxID=2109337 RepID=A0ABW4LHQ2_9MICO